MRMQKPRGRPPHADLLTPGEWRIVEAVRHGMSNPEIAQRRGISVDAVKYHVSNALQKLGLSRRAELRRWQGVRRDSNLHSMGTDMNDHLVLGCIGQIARSVKDIVESRRWYSEVLGLAHLYSFDNLAFYDCDGVRLMLSQGDDGPCESILYFHVEDIRSAHAALAARGIEFTHAPHMIHRHDNGTEEWMAFFQDNEGRPLGIMARVSADM